MFDNPPTSHFGLVGGSVARLSPVIAAARRLSVVAIAWVDVID